MSNFKMIEKLGLEIISPYRASGTEMVRAEDLEALLESAQVVYFSHGMWITEKIPEQTHSALLIGITPLKKKTKAEAALELLERLHSMSGIFNVSWPKDDMKRILEMKDEV